MHKRHFLSALAVLAGSFVLPAAQAAEPLAGRDYQAIQPAQSTNSPGKIEVVEFFSYGCPHCAEFHPIIKKWAAKLPADVAFTRVPVTFNRAAWTNLGKLYYALEASGEIAKFDDLVFVALHQKGVKLYDEKSITEWIGQQGGNTAKFADAFRSFGVQSQIKRAEQMAPAYKVKGVPALAVDGKYLVLNEGIGSFEELLARTDQIIAKARAEKGGK